MGEHLGIPKAATKVSVLDIGAGSGVWGIALAHQSPHVTVQAVDWPRVLQVTKRMALRQGVGDRFATTAGDLLEADFGAGHQDGHYRPYTPQRRPRTQPPTPAQNLSAPGPGGTVAISEFVPNDNRTGPPLPLFFAVNMLVHTEAGDTFTFAEIAKWLKEAGFKNPRQLEAPAPSPLILRRVSVRSAQCAI